MRILSANPAPWLVVNLHHLFSNGIQRAVVHWHATRYRVHNRMRFICDFEPILPSLSVNYCLINKAIWAIIMPNLPFLSNKQTRQESRLTSVDLNLKNCLLTSFRSRNKIPSDVLSCLFCVITSKRWSMIDVAWTEVLQRSVTTH